MSYNISSWKTKKLENLIIPITSLYNHQRKDWHPSQPKITNVEINQITIDCCDGYIIGILKDGNIHVKRIQIVGEGSGTIMINIIEPALKQSTGELEAVLIWEKGDSVSKLHVINGELTETDIEL